MPEQAKIASIKLRLYPASGNYALGMQSKVIWEIEIDFPQN